MRYPDYVIKSLEVFTLSFILGTFINNEFSKYQKTFKNPNRMIFGFSQLIVIISITYMLHSVQYLQQFFEQYMPNVLFSSFLLSLQTNMIDNFKNLLI
jgi:hypothetical protein